MEIYTLTIILPRSEDAESWSRTIEVAEDYSLKQLHKYIQEVVDFDDDHLYEFFLGRNSRGKLNSIPQTSLLNQIYPSNGLKLFYLFDFGDEWLFEIRKSRKKKTKDIAVDYPLIIAKVGENPEQYPSYEEYDE